MSLMNAIDASVMALAALYNFWISYQIAFCGRTSLIRLGRKSLPGAALLATSFARVYLLQGFVFSIAAIVWQYQTLGNTALPFLAICTIPGAIWHAVLINAIERYAKNQLGQATTKA